MQGNLDDARSLGRLAGLATRVLHLAPPPTGESSDWRLDTRTRALVRALVRAQMANLFNDYSWSVSPNGALRYTHSRRFLGELRMEI